MRKVLFRRRVAFEREADDDTYDCRTGESDCVELGVVWLVALRFGGEERREDGALLLVGVRDIGSEGRGGHGRVRELGREAGTTRELFLEEGLLRRLQNVACQFCRCDMRDRLTMSLPLPRVV